MSELIPHPTRTTQQPHPLRVMLLAQFYPPVVGGVEMHVQALARGLVTRGHDVVVATHTTAEHGPGERLDEGARVVSLQGAVQRIGPLFTTERRHAIPLADPGLVRGLRRLATEFRPDIVHAHNWLGRSYVPLKAEIDAPYLVSLHDSGRICTQGRMMYRNVELCSGPSLGRCLSCCAVQFGALKGTITYAGNRMARASEARAVDLFLPVSSAVVDSNHLAFEVVPNFAEDAPTTSLDDPRLAELPAEPFILQVGDVVADKGVQMLFEAYRSLTSPPPVVLIGRITDEMRANLPAGVMAVGTWPHDLVLEAWRRSLFGTMPSLCLDACPTVTLEAMAAGKPVVASALGGLLDQVVDGDTGLLVRPHDAHAHFAADAVIDRIEALYYDLAEKRIRAGSA